MSIWITSKHARDDGYIACIFRHHPILGAGRDLEHRVVMSEVLGRPLNGRSEQVHHIDGDKTNNTPENLRVVDIRDHSSHHSRLNWKDPEFRRRSVEAFRANCARPELREDRKRAALETWQRDEYRKNHQRAMQAAGPKISKSISKAWKERNLREKVHRPQCCIHCGREFNGGGGLSRHLNRKTPCHS